MDGTLLEWNYNYEAGKQFLSLMLLPQSVMPGFNDAEHDRWRTRDNTTLKTKHWAVLLFLLKWGGISSFTLGI